MYTAITALSDSLIFHHILANTKYTSNGRNLADIYLSHEKGPLKFVKDSAQKKYLRTTSSNHETEICDPVGKNQSAAGAGGLGIIRGKKVRETE